MHFGPSYKSHSNTGKVLTPWTGRAAADFAILIRCPFPIVLCHWPSRGEGRGVTYMTIRWLQQQARSEWTAGPSAPGLFGQSWASITRACGGHEYRQSPLTMPTLPFNLHLGPLRRSQPKKASLAGSPSVIRPHVPWHEGLCSTRHYIPGPSMHGTKAHPNKPGNKFDHLHGAADPLTFENPNQQRQ